MKVKTWETVDIEVETEILFSDILSAFDEVIDQSDGQHVNRLTEALGRMTELLARIPDECIAALRPEARGIICDRLNRQRARYEEKGCGMAICSDGG